MRHSERGHMHEALLTGVIYLESKFSKRADHIGCAPTSNETQVLKEMKEKSLLKDAKVKSKSIDKG